MNNNKNNKNRHNEIIRIQKKRSNFVIIDKGFLEDARLSYKAKGILAYLLSKPDQWKVIVKDLMNHAKDGRDSIYAGLKELKAFGYYISAPVRNEKGVVTHWESTIFEDPADNPEKPTPNPEKPNPEKPNPGSPDTGLAEHSKELVSKESVSKELASKELDSKESVLMLIDSFSEESISNESVSNKKSCPVPDFGIHCACELRTTCEENKCKKNKSEHIPASGSSEPIPASSEHIPVPAPSEENKKELLSSPSKGFEKSSTHNHKYNTIAEVDAMVKSTIGYADLSKHPQIELIDTMVANIRSVLMHRAPYISFSKKDTELPTEAVIEVFMSLTQEHILYCVEKFMSQHHVIVNKQRYLKKLLYVSVEEMAADKLNKEAQKRPRPGYNGPYGYGRTGHSRPPVYKSRNWDYEKLERLAAERASRPI
jgi:hypothetical protein